MLTIDSIALYVENIQLSMTFYKKVFECEAKLLSPTFAIVEFAENVKVTLKQSNTLTPSSLVRGGGAELSIPAINNTELDTLFGKWKDQGVNFAQEREESVYGINFVALDPDGHRLRVFA